MCSASRRRHSGGASSASLVWPAQERSDFEPWPDPHYAEAQQVGSDLGHRVGLPLPFPDFPLAGVGPTCQIAVGTAARDRSCAQLTDDRWTGPFPLRSKPTVENSTLLDGLRGKDSIAELCGKEGIAQNEAASLNARFC